MTSEKRNFRRTVVAHAALIAVCGTAAMVAPQVVFAQQTLQRVEVTGSSIRRADAETASPIQVITKEEIDASGKASVAEYLQTLTSDGQGSVPFTYGRGFSQASAAGISLRGLGANATLVLINGRRVAPSVLADDAQRTFVDLNQIPLEAVERVEVLKDGASAIYGSDAVAGVVNIILRKNYVGTAIKASYGVSGKGDGNEPRVAITFGRGDIDTDGYNVLMNLEAGKKDAIFYSDRVGRGNIGNGSIAQYPGSPFDPNGTNNNNTGTASGRLGGAGWIPVNAAGAPVNNSYTSSVIGNVRNGPPTGSTGIYASRGSVFPGAQAYCNSVANLPQNNPAGGCLVDLWQKVGMVQPEMDSLNFYTRFTKKLNADAEGWAEFGYFKSHSEIQRTNVQTASGYFLPDGSVVSRSATSLIGATHPDNPFPGAERRIGYNPTLEIGPDAGHSDSDSFRFAAGVKGSLASWDYDTAVTYSQVTQTDVSEKRINYRVMDALLNPTAANIAAATANSAAYAALPPGTVWRIGENANLNSPALYAAMLQDQSREGKSKQYGIDGKASRELGKLEGGPMSIAVGGEWRHEETNLPLYSGFGDFLGLSLTRYSGKRDIFAAYTELLAPVTKRIELSGALRYDNYTDAGSTVTPKVGGKWRVIDTLALRGTYAEGFRAPSPTENGANSVAAFGGASVKDNARCAAAPTLDFATYCAVAPTFVQQGNPSLEPEKSKSATLGAVWDITPKTSMALDWWQIKRSGLPVIEDTQTAIDQGHLTRDPATAAAPGDPGGILSAYVQFVNAAQSLTRGVDLEVKNRWDLGSDMGRLTSSLTWTHLLDQSVTDPDGTEHKYAGTHGNCEITNCIGSPRDRIQFATAWDYGPMRLGAVINYRGSMSFRPEQGADCYSQGITVAGIDVPSDCKLKSFTTLDISALYRLGKNTEIFGSIQNLLDSKPPFDYMTYGAIGYNPLDYSGAIGRFFRLGVKHKF
jgi:iron complex outermembrane receptor protein